MRVSIDALFDYYLAVYEKTFRDLPIVNKALAVESVGFRQLEEHQLGVLITPWFMNLVLLPGTGRWDDRPQGSACTVELPGGKVDFHVSHEQTLGTILSAALLLRHSLKLEEEAQAVERAVQTVLDRGYRTADIAGGAACTVNTQQMGDVVVAALG